MRWKFYLEKWSYKRWDRNEAAGMMMEKKWKANKVYINKLGIENMNIPKM